MRRVICTTFLLLCVLAPGKAGADELCFPIDAVEPDTVAAVEVPVPDTAAVADTLAPWTRSVMSASQPEPGFHQADSGVVFLGGLAGGALCAAAGIAIGAAGDNESSDDIPEGAILGYLIGETVGVALGVHVANGGRGNILVDFGISTLCGIAALGVGGLVADESTGGVLYLTAVAGQIIATTAVERSAARRKYEDAHPRSP